MIEPFAGGKVPTPALTCLRKSLGRLLVNSTTLGLLGPIAAKVRKKLCRRGSVLNATCFVKVPAPVLQTKKI